MVKLLLNTQGATCSWTGCAHLWYQADCQDAASHVPNCIRLCVSQRIRCPNHGASLPVCDSSAAQVLQGPVLQQCCCCFSYHNGLLDLGAMKHTRLVRERQHTQLFKLRDRILRALCFQRAVAVAMGWWLPLLLSTG